MLGRSRKNGAPRALFMAGLVLVPVHLAGQTTTKTKREVAPAPQSSPARKSTAQHLARGKSSRKPVRTSRRPRRISHKRRLAQLRLQPERVEEIQRALEKVGYLNEAPTGKWDEATRDAMHRYQADNGFPITGLPEAKSLMKLGLGPHPLPEDVVANDSASASVRSNTSPAQAPSVTQDPPESHSPGNP